MYDQYGYQEHFIRRSIEMSKYYARKPFSLERIDNLAVKKRLPPRFIKFLRDAWNGLEQSYPGRVDIQFKFEPVFKTHVNRYGSNHINSFEIFQKLDISYVYLIIHFPEVKVSNSKKNSVTIKDLFTRILVRLQETPGSYCLKPKFERIQGMRATASLIEYNAGYKHSHLKQTLYAYESNRLEYSSFCTGSGDIVSSELLLNNEYSEDILNLMLLQVDPFVRWESLEGVPHFRMSKLGTGTAELQHIDFSNCAYIYYNILDYLRRNNFTPNIDWRYRGGKYEIVENEKFEAFFRYLERDYPAYFLNRDDQGEYYATSPLPPSVVDTSTYAGKFVYFRGEKIFFKVDGTIKQENQTKYINPQIKNYVRSRMEYKANSTKIREVRVNQ